MDLIHRKRLSRIRKKLREKSLDAFLILNIESSDPANLSYLTGFDCTTGLLMVTEEEVCFLTDGRYLDAAREKLTSFQISAIDKDPLRAAVRRLEKIEGQQIAVDKSRVTLAVYREIQNGLTNKDLKGVDNFLQSMREVKDPSEIALQTKAAQITEDAMCHARKQAQIGMTEKELAIRIESFIKRSGAEDVSFDPIVTSGKNTARPHAQPSEKELEQGDLLLMDIGAKYKGYCSDMTRTFCLGEPTPKARKIYNLTVQAQKAAFKALAPGEKGRSVDKRAREVIEEGGYGESFSHSLGHGVGLEVHEPPKLSQSSDGVLKQNMVTTVEPGIYLSGWGGVRIEDMAVITESGYRCLTNPVAGTPTNILRGDH